MIRAPLRQLRGQLWQARGYSKSRSDHLTRSMQQAENQTACFRHRFSRWSTIANRVAHGLKMAQPLAQKLIKDQLDPGLANRLCHDDHAGVERTGSKREQDVFVTIL